MDLMTRRRTMMLAASAEPNGLEDGTIVHANWTGAVENGVAVHLTSTAAYKQLILPLKRPVQIKTGDAVALRLTASGSAPFSGVGIVEEWQLSTINANTSLTRFDFTAAYDYLLCGIWIQARTGNYADVSVTASLSVNGETIF